MKFTFFFTIRRLQFDTKLNKTGNVRIT